MARKGRVKSPNMHNCTKAPPRWGLFSYRGIGVANASKFRILQPMLSLEIHSRDAKESSDALRKRGVVPAVFYGPKEAATPIAIDALRIERVWKEAGETTIVKLEGVGEAKDTLIHDVQFHPITGKVLHADFYVLEKGKLMLLLLKRPATSL